MATKAKSQARGQKPAPVIVHEVTDTKHRIAQIRPGEGSDAGEWVSHNQIAEFGVYRATAGDVFSGVLPKGVFLVRSTEFTAL